MNSIVIYDHYNGIYPGEQTYNYKLNPDSNDFIIDNKSSLAESYRNKRKQFNEFLKNFDEEFLLNIIETEINQYEKLLKEHSPEIYGLFIEDKLFSDFQYHYRIANDENLLIASYIIFLYEKYNYYEKIENIKIGEVIWLRDQKSFSALCEILNKFGIIKCDLKKFKKFFALKECLEFNSNIFETTYIFNELIKNNFISERTVKNLISSELIFAMNGSIKKHVLLSQEQFRHNSNKHSQNDSLNKINKFVQDAKNEFLSTQQ